MTPDMPPSVLEAPYLEVFYASTCLPCRIEAPFLAEIAKGKTLRLTITLLTDPAKAKQELAAISPELAQRATPLPATLPARQALTEAGDADGVLPFARMIGTTGKTCASWRGILSKAVIEKLFARCKLGVF